MIEGMRLMLGGVALLCNALIPGETRAQATESKVEDYRAVANMEVFLLVEIGLTLPLPEDWFVVVDREVSGLLPLVDDVAEARAVAAMTQHLYVEKSRATKWTTFAAIRIAMIAEPPRILEQYPTNISYANGAMMTLRKSVAEKSRILSRPQAIKIAEQEFAAFELLVDYRRGTIYTKCYVAYINGQVLAITLYGASRDLLRDADAYIGGISFHTKSQ